MSLLIAMDYDGTYTAAPVLWRVFIRTAIAHGYRVILATMRYPEEGADICPELRSLVEHVYFTSRKAKKPALAALGVHPHIWVDDRPDFVVGDAMPAFPMGVGMEKLQTGGTT